MLKTIKNTSVTHTAAGDMFLHDNEMFQVLRTNSSFTQKSISHIIVLVTLSISSKM